MSDEPPIIDTSHVDRYLRSRHKVEVLNSAWKPVLAGAAGAVAIIGAVVVGVWVAGPRFSYREVEIPRVTMRDVTADHVVPRDVQVDRIVPHEVPIEIPQIVITRTPQESAFANSPAFTNAEIKGRIVASPDGISLAFDTGKSWVPTDPTMAADSARFVGDLGACSPIPGTEHFHCVALHGGKVVPIRQKPLGRPT
jgi:hypothetical protein